MKIARFQFNMFGVNTYVVWSQTTKECMVIDPGMFSPDENISFDNFIREEGLTIKYLVNTHLHLDHCFGNNHVANKYGVKTLAHPDDHFFGHGLLQQLTMFGIKTSNISDINDIEPLTADSTLRLGDETISVIHVPGHSPGGIALYSPLDEWAIVGDSVFAGGGIGRTDLQGGDYRTLLNSIETRIFSLPDSVTLLPGHGPESTVKEEKSINPYV